MLPALDVGLPGDAYRPVKDAFEQRGLRISNTTIACLRSGATRPTRTMYRLACADTLRAGDGSSKTQYCLHVLSVGLERRQPNREPPWVYTSSGLTRAMGAVLGYTHLQLSYVLRTMRADLALWSTRTPDDHVAAEFRAAASLFLRVHGPRSWRVLHGTNDVINAAWDQSTIHGFYVAWYSIAGSAIRGACPKGEQRERAR
jgi:hypothetical protein